MRTAVTVRAVVAVTVGAGLLRAQSTTSRTICTPIGTMLSCATTTKSPPPTKWDALSGIAQGMAADKALRDQADALRAQRDYENAARVDAQLEANRRSAALFRAFAPRATMVIRRGLDSVATGGGRMDSLYWNEASRAATNLFSISPEASNQYISDVLEPIVKDYQAKRRSFDSRAIALLTRLSDSLGLKGERKSVFWDEASKPLLSIRAKDWQANERDLRLSVNDVVDSTARGLILEAARAETGKPPKPKPPIN